MSKPLAVVCYSNLLPGSQICNRLLDLGYAVQTCAAEKLTEMAERERPMLIVVEATANACAAIGTLKKSQFTEHVPVLAYSDGDLTAARFAGASLVASSSAISAQLPQLLEQVLMVE